jgi:prepilin-type N-terminal cleavage/methylation domain-containing protein
LITRSTQSAFSLVELSIVLVILGLLTGGILGGQALIRAAELRAVSSEFQRYTTAIHTFKDKYFALPGDMRNATQFWLRQSSGVDCVTNSSAAISSPGSCDGNGDGFLFTLYAANTSNETHQAWRQMALAGLIEGSYTGLADATVHGTAGVNIPSSRLSRNNWRYYFLSQVAPGNPTAFAGYGFNIFASGDALRAEEVWNLDSKFDDGIPGRGAVTTFPWNACTLAANNTDFAAGYNFNASALCRIYVRTD